MAIIAALSVQYSKAGMNVFQLYFSPSRVSALLSPVLADTPPAMHIFYACFYCSFLQLIE